MSKINSKISKYTPKELCKILPYQLVYHLLLRLERRRVANGTEWKKIESINSPKFEQFSYFYSHIRTDKNALLLSADRILAGEIEIFGTWYPFDHVTDWLKDPISRLEWNKNDFCHTAPIYVAEHCDVKYVLEVNKMNHLVEVAVAFYYTQDDKYADYIAGALKSWMQTVKPGRSVACRIVMDLGFRILNLTQILLLCVNSKKAHDKIAPLALTIIKEHIHRIKRFSTPRWFKTGNGANHVTGEMIGYIVGVLFLEKYNVLNKRTSLKNEWHYLMDVLDRTIAPSGAYLEMSSNYTRVVTEFLVYFDFILDAFNLKNECVERYRVKQYTDRLRSYLYHTTYHGKLTNEGDNDDARVLVSFRPNAEEVNYIFKGYEPLPCIPYLDGSRWMFRSEDVNDLFLFTRVGRFSPFRDGAGIHAHCDLLSLIMGVRGEMIFIDKGCSFYNSGQDIRKADQCASSHNLLTIEGRQMCEPLINCYGVSPYSECIESKCEPKVCSFKGQLDYKDVKQSRMVTYDGNRIVITDNIKIASDATLGFTLNFLLNPKVNAEILENNQLKLYTATQGFYVSFEGVESLAIKGKTYSPSFTVVHNTLAIEAKGYMQRNAMVRTVIEII